MVEQADAPGGGLQELGQQVEHRGLARPVGADQGVYPGMVHVQIDVVDRDEAAELLAQAARREHHGSIPSDVASRAGLNGGHAHCPTSSQPLSAGLM